MRLPVTQRKPLSRNVSKLTVVLTTMPCFYVFDPFDRSDVASSTMMFETNMASGKCRPCRVSEQLQIPCRHVQAVLYFLERQNPGVPALYRVLQYFHPAYLVRTVHDAFDSVKISLPVGTVSTVKSSVLPAPLYRQAGGARKARAADIQRGEKRIHSRGEEIQTQHQQRSAARAILPARDAVDEFDDSPDIHAFFQSQLSAESKADRAEYQCSRCGFGGHNATTCSVTGQDVEEVGTAIRQGVYILGSPPLSVRNVLAANVHDLNAQ